MHPPAESKSGETKRPNQLPIILNAVLPPERSVTLVEDDIYTVLKDPLVRHRYDRRAAVYDALVNSVLYGRVAWGSLPEGYVSFAREAITASLEGRFLDAGCGSLLFTAASYLDSGRPIIAFDESLAMLRRARTRLVKFSGAVPAHIVLLQGNLTDLPFLARSFQGVLCMNVLHHIEDAGTLIRNLKGLLLEEGCLHLTSLVYNHRFVGDLYLDSLHSSGQFARPRSSLEMRHIMDQALGDKVLYRLQGNMLFASY